MADPFESAVETAFPKEPIDPIQGAVDDLKEDNNFQMRANMAVSSEVNPDEHAKALALSDETGVPVQTVKRNIKKVNGIATRNKLPLTDIEKSPAVLKFLSDPDNAMVSHDDMKATTDLDQILRSPKLGIERTDATFELSNLGGKAMNGPLSPKEEKRVAELQDFLSQDTGADTFVEKLAVDTFEFGSQIGTVLSRAVKSGLALGGTLAGGTAIASAVGGPLEGITVPLAFAGGFGVGSVTSTVQDVNALEGNLAFLDFRAIKDENGVPLDPRIAAIAARAVGAANAGIELTGLGFLTKLVPPLKKLTNFVTRESTKRVLQNPAVLARLGRLAFRTAAITTLESGQETVQEAVNIIAQEVAKATDPDTFKAITGGQIVDRLGTTFIQSARGFALLSLIAPAASFVGETRGASKARKSAEKLSNMIEKAKESKLRNRSQTRFEQLVKGMAENTGDENVFIPADKVNELFQSEEVSPEILDELGVKDQFDQAMSVGGDLVIPVEKIASVMPDNKALDNLLPHMRFEGEGMSLAEADQFLNDEEAVRKEFIDNAQVALEKDRTDVSQSNQIEDVIFNQIRETGEAIDVSRKQAQVFAAGIKTAAFNAGISPLELFGDTNLQIKRELPETLKKATVDELDFFIEEARKGGPKQADAFGSTLTDFVRSRGIKDDRGDLAAFEIDKQRKPGQKNILRDDGQSIDDVALAAQEAGFFPEFYLNAGDRIDINQFVDALAEGDKRFSPLEGNAQAQEKLQAIDDLNRVLDERGIDINTASNEEIKAALKDQFIIGDGNGENVVSRKDFFQSQEANNKLSTVETKLTGSEINALLEFQKNKTSKKAPGKVAGAAVEAGIISNKLQQDASNFLKNKEDINLSRIKSRPGIDPLITAKERRPGKTKSRLEESRNKSLENKKKKEAEKINVEKEKNIIKAASSALNWTKDMADSAMNDLLFFGVPGRGEENTAALNATIESITRNAKKRGWKIIYRSGKAKSGGSVYIDIQDHGIVRVSDHVLPDTARRQDTINKGGQFWDAEYILGSEWRNHTIEQYLNEIESSLKDGGLFQKKDNDTNKGGISFQDNEVSIRLFESSDLSTLLHEGGHFFLELRRQMIERGIASSEQVEDFNKVGDWFAENAEISFDWVKKNKPDLVAEIEKRGGIDYVRNLGQSVDLDRSSDPVDAAIATGYHELFARGFETYLREGKAPSLELRDAFRSIKEWFRRIYRDLVRLNAPLSDDIRGIMDRMLATESQIAEVEAINNYEIMSGLSELMTDAENIAYNKSSKAGTERGNEELMAKAVAQVTREKKKWYKDELAKITKEVEDDVWSRPVYKVLWLLRNGENRTGDTPENLKGVKLSRSALVDFYGEGVLKHIPKSVPPIFRKSGGIHQDVIAEINGFKSGDDMIKALINAPAPKALIKQEADAIMKQRHGDIFNDGTIEQEAQEIVHNEPRAAFMAIEMRKLSQKSGRANTPIKIIKDAAKRIIGDMAVDKVVKPSLFLRAEQRARKQSQQALIDKDFNKAQIEKRNEILNFHLYKEALKARDEVQKKTKYMTGLLGRKATKKKIDSDYLKKIQDILTAFNFGPRLSDAKRTKLEVQALNSFIVDKQKDDNAEFIIPAEIQEADARGVTHFRDMTMNEFRGLRDIIKNIETQGRRKLGYETNKAKRDFDEAKRTLIERALDKNKIRKGAIKQQSQQNPDFFDKVSETFAGIDASLLKAEQVIEWLDGGSDGPWRDLIFDPIAAAQGREDELHLEFTKKIVDLFEGMTKEIKNKLNDRITVETLGRTFLRSDLIAMALNVGNEGNFEKMLDGAGWNENQVMEALRILSKEEWDFIQGTWDTINELWPEIEAVDKRMTGVAPIKVEPRKFQTQFGEMKGGYYPVVYDPRRSKRDTKAMSENDMFSPSYTRATTSHGFTKERTGFSGELLLTLEAIPKHIAEVVHDITHREVVMAVDKLLSDPEVRKVINDTMNPQIHKMLRAWNKSIANDKVGQETNLNFINGILRSARLNATAAIMGFKATVNLSQLAGYTMSIEAMSDMKGNKRVLAKTTAQFTKNPMKMARFVQEKSVEMKFRLNNNDRDIRENMRKMMDKGGFLDGARAASLHAIGIFDMAVSVPTWMAAYNLKLSETNNEKKAVSFADRTVRLSQGAGAAKDLSEIQRGGANKNEFTKMWTMFYGFFNVLYSRLRDSGRELRTINDMPKFASRMWYLVVLSPIISELLAGRGPDDDESEAAWAARKVISFPFMSVPFMRDLASAIEFSSSGRVNVQGPPTIKMYSQLAKLMVNGFDGGEFNRTKYRAALDAAGLFGVPATSQTYITSTYLWDYYTGEVDDFEISGLLFARPPKK